jgi:hypothetical protein
MFSILALDAFPFKFDINFAIFAVLYVCSNILFKKNIYWAESGGTELRVVVHTCNPSTW